jgi:MFS family permease
MSIQGTARYLVLAAMSLLYFLLMAGTFNALGVVLPAMVRDLGMSWTEAGFGFTLLGVACGLASLIPAALIRRIGESLTLVVGTLVLAAGFACLSATHSVLLYHVGTTLMGLGFCFCGTVPGIHVISGLFERRSTALGVYFSTGGLGSVVGPLLFYSVGGLLSHWRLFWAAFAVASLVVGGFAALATMVRRPDPSQPAQAAIALSGGWSAREAMRTPQFWIVVAAYTACLLINTTVHSFAVQHIGERGLSLSSAAGFISIAALIGAAASSFAGLMGEKSAPRSLTLLALGSLTIASLALVLPQSGVTLGLFAAMMGLGLGVSYVATAVLLLDFFGHRANLELYSLMCAISTSAAIGPALGGIERDDSGSFSAVFATLAVIGVALFLCLLFTRRPRRVAASDAPNLAAEFA